MKNSRGVALNDYMTHHDNTAGILVLGTTLLVTLMPEWDIGAAALHLPYSSSTIHILYPERERLRNGSTLLISSG